MESTWRALGGHLEATWRTLEDHLKASWRPFAAKVALGGKLEGPSGVPKAPKRLQVESKRQSSQVGPKTLQEAPERLRVGLQRRPRGAQDTPRGNQDAPRAAPRRSKSCPRFSKLGSEDVQERSKSYKTAVREQLDSKQRHPAKTVVFLKKIHDFAGQEPSGRAV